jgi:hypothetical protein
MQPVDIDRPYIEKEFALENEILASSDRISAICGAIVLFLVGARGEVTISKNLVRIARDSRRHDRGDVMRVSTANGKLVVKQSKRGRPWNALSNFEKAFLVELESILKANTELILHRAKKRRVGHTP